MPNFNRVFSERILFSPRTDGTTEWHVLAREGILGPYQSKEVAERTLCEFIAFCRITGATGGRGEVVPTTRLENSAD